MRSQLILFDSEYKPVWADSPCPDLGDKLCIALWREKIKESCGSPIKPIDVLYHLFIKSTHTQQDVEIILRQMFNDADLAHEMSEAWTNMRLVRRERAMQFHKYDSKRRTKSKTKSRLRI